jgi:hypothetical protein
MEQNIIDTLQIHVSCLQASCNVLVMIFFLKLVANLSDMSKLFIYCDWNYEEL